jgi:hypothetical protein
MTIVDLANGLVAKVRTGDYAGAIGTYYHPEIVSVEAAGEPREVVGIDACRQKGEWWSQSFQIHGASVDGPYLGDGQFVVRYTYDVTNRGTGIRSTFDELALYWVQNGQVVREQFFYHTPGM